MGIQRRGFFRYLFFFLGLGIIHGSSVIPVVFRPSVEQQAQEHRLYRKSRMASMVIPRKSALWIDNSRAMVDLKPYLEQEMPDLALLNSPELRDLVIDFFVDIAGDEEIALFTLYYTDLYKVSPLLAFSVAYYESRFQPMAVNQNPTSVDRGVFQLNNLSFPRLSEEDFFNIHVNIFHGIRHLEWCISVTSSYEEALGVYNAGLSRIRRGEYPASTLVYIRRIMNYRETLERELIHFIASRL